jgi:hypothetical protein
VAIRTGLAGQFRLAALHQEQEQQEWGRVPVKCSEEYKAKEATLSPYQTFHIEDHWKRTRYLTYGSVHVNYGLFNTPPVKLGKRVATDAFIASVIVHEAAHKWCGLTDAGGYLDEPNYFRVDPEIRLKNADCYSTLALSVYLDEVIDNVNNPKVSQ